jgi:tRNA pseudouridine38-40 synthase
MRQPDNLHRIVLCLEYDGSRFFGWQWQIEQRNIQHELQQALSKIAQHSITVHCAGRTDTGVHATEQIVHFDTIATRTLEAWHRGTNTHLPPDIRVIWAKEAVNDFHARYSAIARFYRYVILNRTTPSALNRQTTWCPLPLDEKKMHQAAQCLIGQHDFTSFRAQGCQSKSPFRKMYFIDVYRENEKVVIELSANAFLHHMVRNIAGVLMAIGSGKQPVSWTEVLLDVKSRKLGGVTAPSDGLHLAGVYYPEHYGITTNPIFKKLPADARRFD